MPVRLKSGPIDGGSWVGPFGDGNISVKLGAIGGGSWRGCGGLHLKIGPIGGGYWVDSGYRGYPNEPANVWVHNWDNSNYQWVQIAWNFVGSGPTVSQYQCRMLDSGGNVMSTQTLAANDNIAQFNVNPDWVIQFQVRSLGANGLNSDWKQGPRVRMGHVATPNYGWVQHSRYWDTGGWGGYVLKDQVMGYDIRGDIYIQGMHWRNLRYPSGQFVSPSGTPPNQRFVEWVVYSLGYGYISDTYGQIRSGDNRDHALGNWANDTPSGYVWGIRPRGTGWSTGTNPAAHALWADNFWISGTEYYWNHEIVSWNPAVSNSYW